MNIKKENKFSGFELGENLIKSLHVLGYEQPTEIQKTVLPIMLAGKDVLVKAPTGSGKTAAFGIPVCEQIRWDEKLPQALVLEPTRELTDQVREEIFYIGRLKRIKIAAVFGGFPIEKQIQTLRQMNHIIVGTPGRLLDHIGRESLNLEKIRHVIIDEADLMLDMGFADDVREILSHLPQEVGISLFSATLKPEVCQLAEGFSKEAVTVTFDTPADEKPLIEQRIYKTDAEEKYATFVRILKAENPESAIIFCGTREMVRVLFEKMRRNRIFCGMLHGEMEQRERMKTVNAFRRGGFRFLIATDVAARGVDFENISHVINYDFPTGTETYVHRIGRTGRNGKSGTAVSIICEEEQRMLSQVERYMDQTLAVQEHVALTESAEKDFWKNQRTKVEVKPQKGSGFQNDITRISIGGGRKSKIRSGDIVATICSIEGVQKEDVGIIDIRDSISFVEILNRKGDMVFNALESKTLKGKIRKVKKVKASGKNI